MTNIIKLQLKKSVGRWFSNDPTYRNCQLVVREMSKRGFGVADSFFRSRYGLDLFALLLTCKTLLRPDNSSHIAEVSLNFLSAHAQKIFTECNTREEVLCKLYELKHTITNAMQYQLQFTGILNENVATTRSLERIIDSAIFSINCLDVDFINSNPLAIKETLNLLGYDTEKKPANLSATQLQVLITLLLWRAAFIAEQTVYGDLQVNLKSAITLLSRYIKKAPDHPPLDLIKLVLLNIYPEESNDYRLIKSVITSHEVLEAQTGENIKIEEDVNLPLFTLTLPSPLNGRGEVSSYAA